MEYVVPVDEEFVVVNPLVLQEFFLVMFASGLCIGVGLYGISAGRGVWFCAGLLSLGVILGAIVMRVLPRKGVV
jgi:hypothetical protein